MRKLFIIIFTLFFAFPVFGQDNIKEAYFHELHGMEDSSGVTHLFYRLYYKYGAECSYTNHEGETETYSFNIDRNNLRQFNTKVETDTLRFMEGERLWSECSTTYPKLYNFEFFDNDPKKLFKISTDDAHWFTPGLSDWRGNGIGLGASPANTIGIDTIRGQLLLPTPFEYILIKSKGEYSNLKKTLRAKLDGSNWEDLGYYTDFPDSLLIDFTIIGINPFRNEEYLGVSGDSLLRSTNHGDSLSVILKHNIFSKLLNVLFNLKEKRYYFVTEPFSISPQIKKRIWQLSLNDTETTLNEIQLENDIHAVSNDISNSGHLYIADSSEVFISTDYGEDFSPFKTFEETITGLYKKPNSDILYVLTKEELLEVNTETKQTTSLKQLPVSSEQVTDVPTQVTLEQNYPNPFNPSTVIRYQLNSNQLVRLEVFDVTGRKVAVLVDGERKSAGQHRVTFDGSGLSSGVYFYRLDAGGQILTQKMMLVK